MPKPACLAEMGADRVVELDVREDLREGREPFGRIMAAKESVPTDGALMLRATFEPAPLYKVLGRQGFAHWTEHRGEEDWVVWFYRGPAAAGAGADDGVGGGERPGDSGAAGLGSDDGGQRDGVVVLDVRGLEPPEPMVRTLAALETLPRGHTLVQLNVREPKFLLPQLEERGFEYEIREETADLVRVFISRAERVLDVRVIPPREKHPAIFETFGALGAGESFILVNDHDPKPLRYQFEFEHEGEYGWEYLEEGPAVWRVRLSRVEA